MVTCSNLKIKAYGKINLALDIVGKRDDGFIITKAQSGEGRLLIISPTP